MLRCTRFQFILFRFPIFTVNPKQKSKLTILCRTILQSTPTTIDVSLCDFPNVIKTIGMLNCYAASQWDEK